MSDNTAGEKWCANCRFVEHHERNDAPYDCDARKYVYEAIRHTYTCRRNPPIVTDIGGRRPGGSGSASLNDFGWPEVRARDWCGEFAPAVSSDHPEGS